jgi:hypothetical protein
VGILKLRRDLHPRLECGAAFFLILALHCKGAKWSQKLAGEQNLAELLSARSQGRTAEESLDCSISGSQEKSFLEPAHVIGKRRVILFT